MHDRLLQIIERHLVNAANRHRRAAVPETADASAPVPSPPETFLVGHERDAPGRPTRRAQTPVRLTEAEIGKHLVFHARTGAGKSVALLNLVQQWMASGHGLILFDPDGSQAPQVAALLSRHETPDSVADRLLYIDLDEDGWVVPLNVLSGADESCALRLLDAIERQWGAEFGPVVGRGMRAAVFTAARARPSLTFGDLPLLFESEPLRAQVLPTADAASQRLWREFDGEMTPAQRRAYRDPVVNRLEAWLSASTVAAMLSYPRGLDFRALFANRPDLCVVVNLATRRAAGASRLLASLLWAQVLSQLMHPDRVGDQTKPVLIVADEYQNLASEEAMMTCLAEARKYKLSLCLASQVFSRLSKPMRDSVLGNCFCTFAFSSGDTGDFAPYVHFEGDPLPKSDIAAFLARQKVGESVLVRPGLPSVCVRHLPPPEAAKGNPAAVRALIEASYHAYALPRAEALRQITQRQERLTRAPETEADAAPPRPVPAQPAQAARRAARKPLLAPEEHDG